MKIRATMSVGNVIYSRHFDLPESPLAGDTVTVWNDEGTGGLHLTIKERHWDSKHMVLDLVCCFTGAEFDAESLKELGWK